MNQDERASQLSAMFDGELPALECELLSRRLARDEQLRATWSRYAVIGSALRAEPLAKVGPDFARRVSAALAGGVSRWPSRRARRTARLLRGTALGTAVAASVAGVAIILLRNGLPPGQVAVIAPGSEAAAQPALAARGLRVSPELRVVGGAGTAAAGADLASYVVPPLTSDNNLALQGSLAEYVVAHSEVSNSLARGSVLSALVSNERVRPAPGPVMGAAAGNGNH